MFGFVWLMGADNLAVEVIKERLSGYSYTLERVSETEAEPIRAEAADYIIVLLSHPTIKDTLSGAGSVLTSYGADLACRGNIRSEEIIKCIINYYEPYRPFDDGDHFMREDYNDVVKCLLITPMNEALYDRFVRGFLTNITLYNKWNIPWLCAVAEFLDKKDVQTCGATNELLVQIGRAIGLGEDFRALPELDVKTLRRLIRKKFEAIHTIENEEEMIQKFVGLYESFISVNTLVVFAGIAHDREICSELVTMISRVKNWANEVDDRA